MKDMWQYFFIQKSLNLLVLRCNKEKMHAFQLKNVTIEIHIFWFSYVFFSSPFFISCSLFLLFAFPYVCPTDTALVCAKTYTLLIFCAAFRLCSFSFCVQWCIILHFCPVMLGYQSKARRKKCIILIVVIIILAIIATIIAVSVKK